MSYPKTIVGRTAESAHLQGILHERATGSYGAIRRTRSATIEKLDVARRAIQVESEISQSGTGRRRPRSADAWGCAPPSQTPPREDIRATMSLAPVGRDQATGDGTAKVDAKLASTATETALEPVYDSAGAEVVAPAVHGTPVGEEPAPASVPVAGITAAAAGITAADLSKITELMNQRFEAMERALADAVERRSFRSASSAASAPRSREQAYSQPERLHSTGKRQSELGVHSVTGKSSVSRRELVPDTNVHTGPPGFPNVQYGDHAGFPNVQYGDHALGYPPHYMYAQYPYPQGPPPWHPYGQFGGSANPYTTNEPKANFTTQETSTPKAQATNRNTGQGGSSSGAGVGSLGVSGGGGGGGGGGDGGGGDAGGVSPLDLKSMLFITDPKYQGIDFRQLLETDEDAGRGSRIPAEIRRAMYVKKLFTSWGAQTGAVMPATVKRVNGDTAWSSWEEHCEKQVAQLWECNEKRQKFVFKRMQAVPEAQQILGRFIFPRLFAKLSEGMQQAALSGQYTGGASHQLDSRGHIGWAGGSGTYGSNDLLTIEGILFLILKAVSSSGVTVKERLLGFIEAPTPFKKAPAREVSTALRQYAELIAVAASVGVQPHFWRNVRLSVRAIAFEAEQVAEDEVGRDLLDIRRALEQEADIRGNTGRPSVEAVLGYIEELAREIDALITPDYQLTYTEKKPKPHGRAKEAKRADDEQDTGTAAKIAPKPKPTAKPAPRGPKPAPTSKPRAPPAPGADAADPNSPPSRADKPAYVKWLRTVETKVEECPSGASKCRLFGVEPEGCRFGYDCVFFHQRKGLKACHQCGVDGHGTAFHKSKGTGTAAKVAPKQSTENVTSGRAKAAGGDHDSFRKELIAWLSHEDGSEKGNAQAICRRQRQQDEHSQQTASEDDNHGETSIAREEILGFLSQGEAAQAGFCGVIGRNIHSFAQHRDEEPAEPSGREPREAQAKSPEGSSETKGNADSNSAVNMQYEHSKPRRNSGSRETGGEGDKGVRGHGPGPTLPRQAQAKRQAPGTQAGDETQIGPDKLTGDETEAGAGTRRAIAREPSAAQAKGPEGSSETKGRADSNSAVNMQYEHSKPRRNSGSRETGGEGDKGVRGHSPGPTLPRQAKAKRQAYGTRTGDETQTGVGARRAAAREPSAAQAKGPEGSRETEGLADFKKHEHAKYKDDQPRRNSGSRETGGEGDKGRRGHGPGPTLPRQEQAKRQGGSIGRRLTRAFAPKSIIALLAVGVTIGAAMASKDTQKAAPNLVIMDTGADRVYRERNVTDESGVIFQVELAAGQFETGHLTVDGECILKECPQTLIPLQTLVRKCGWKLDESFTAMRKRNRVVKFRDRFGQPLTEESDGLIYINAEDERRCRRDLAQRYNDSGQFELEQGLLRHVCSVGGVAHHAGAGVRGDWAVLLLGRPLEDDTLRQELERACANPRFVQMVCCSGLKATELYDIWCKVGGDRIEFLMQILNGTGEVDDIDQGEQQAAVEIDVAPHVQFALLATEKLDPQRVDHFRDHHPYDPNCIVCRRTRRRRAKFRRGHKNYLPAGRVLHLDFAGPKFEKGHRGARRLLCAGCRKGVDKDEAAEGGPIIAEGLKSRSADEVVEFLDVAARELRMICWPTQSPEAEAGEAVPAPLPPPWYIHCDRAKEFLSSKVRKWAISRNATIIYGVSYRSTTNAYAEQVVQRCEEGMRATLYAGRGAADHEPSWLRDASTWPYAARTYCRNTNKKRYDLDSVINTTPLRAFGQRGHVKLPLRPGDKKAPQRAEAAVRYLSHVVDSAGSVWVAVEDSSHLDVRDVLDRDVSWSDLRGPAEDGGDSVQSSESSESDASSASEDESCPDLDSSSESDTDGEDSPVEPEQRRARKAPRRYGFAGRTVGYGHAGLTIGYGSSEKKALADGWSKEEIDEACEAEATQMEEIGSLAFPTSGLPSGLEVTVLPLFHILAGKNMERPRAERKLKCRFVLHGGREVAWTTGQRVESPQEEVQAVGGMEVRVALYKALSLGFVGRTGDVKGAYLTAIARGEAYAKLPAWVIKRLFGEAGSKVINPHCRVVRAIYGRKASGFDWSRKAEEDMKTIQWAADPTYPSVWTRRGEGGMIIGITLFYVDDTFVFAETVSQVEIFVAEMRQQGIEVGELMDIFGALSQETYVGVGYKVEPYGGPPGTGSMGYWVRIDQRAYARVLVERFVEEASELAFKSRIRRFDVPALEREGTPGDADRPGVFARSAPRHVGGLLYLGRFSRPDMMYAIIAIARHVAGWKRGDDLALARIFGYLSGTVEFVLHGVVGPARPKILTYADSDFAGDPTTRRSTACVLVYFAAVGTRALADWIMALSKRVYLSTCEAEAGALMAAGKAVLPLQDLTGTLSHEGDGKAPLRVLSDAQAAISAVQKGYSKAMRYARRASGVALAWLKENLQQYLGKVPSEENTSDIGTKPLEALAFEKHRRGLGVWQFNEKPTKEWVNFTEC